MKRALLVALACVLGCETEVPTISVAEDIDTNIEGDLDNARSCFTSTSPPPFLVLDATPTGSASTTIPPFVIVEAFTQDGFVVTVHEGGEDGEVLAEETSTYDKLDAPFAFNLSAEASTGDTLQGTFTVVETCDF